MDADVLVVGGGMAGSLLAYKLHARGARVFLVHAQRPGEAFSAAAGVYNPIAGRHMALSWWADRLWPCALSTYRELEGVLEKTLVHERPMVRPFPTAQDKHLWYQKYSGDAQYAAFAAPYTQSLPAYFWGPFGGLSVYQAGYVDTQALCQGIHGYLAKQGSMHNGVWDASKLQVHSNGVVYQDIRALKVIFCQGALGGDNPFLPALNFRIVKGEVALLRMAQPISHIYNQGITLVPLQQDLAILGASYDWKDRSSAPTKHALQQLLGKLAARCKLPYTVLEQKAGLRPATFDRRPFLGMIPTSSCIGIFNGLGTKGVTLAPYLAECMLEHILYAKPLPEQVSIYRPGALL